MMPAGHTVPKEQEITSTGMGPMHPRKRIWRQFRKNKRALISFYLLLFFLFLYIFADILANNKPLMATVNGETYFPALKEYVVNVGLAEWTSEERQMQWKEVKYERVIWPLIPYGPKEQDSRNVRKAPGEEQNVSSSRWRHMLGTDILGRDLLAGMIHAVRVDLSIGVVAMGVAALIGILLGSLAGFFGDDKLKISRIRLLLNLIFLFFAFYYAFSVRSYDIQDAAAAGVGALMIQFIVSLGIFILVMALGNILAIPLEKISVLAKKVALPLDITVSRLIEVILSIPIIFLIIMILAMVEGGSIFWVMVVIGFTRWTGIARLIRAELLRIRSLEYIESAQSLGFSKWRILIKHAIPNALAPVFVAIAFGIAGAILVEAFLSFIGIGVPPDVQTWGSMLSEGRQSPRDWWLTLFPGIAIFITVTIFNLIGEGLSDALDPKVRH